MLCFLKMRIVILEARVQLLELAVGCGVGPQLIHLRGGCGRLRTGDRLGEQAMCNEPEDKRGADRRHGRHLLHVDPPVGVVSAFRRTSMSCRLNRTQTPGGSFTSASRPTTVVHSRTFQP